MNRWKFALNRIRLGFQSLFEQMAIGFRLVDRAYSRHSELERKLWRVLRFQLIVFFRKSGWYPVAFGSAKLLSQMTSHMFFRWQVVCFWSLIYYYWNGEVHWIVEVYHSWPRPKCTWQLHESVGSGLGLQADDEQSYSYRQIQRVITAARQVRPHHQIERNHQEAIRNRSIRTGRRGC